MINSKMTFDEINRELSADIKWMHGRLNGWMKKYRKQLRSKHIPNGNVLAITPYSTPNKNKAWAILQKRHINYSNYNEITFQVLFEDEQTGRFFYHTIGEKKNDVFIIFTKHALDRLKERGNMNVFELLIQFSKTQNGAWHIEEYNYNNEEDVYFLSMGDGVFIVVENGSNLICKTYLHKSNEFSNQLELHIKSRKKALEYSEKWHESIYNNINPKWFGVKAA